jgi:predicted GNAT family acetyltransferase
MEVPFAVIHVREDNHAARSVYEKVGFKPYMTSYILRGERII